MSHLFPQELVALLIPIVALSLSLMIPIVAIIADYYRKKNQMRVLEKAIEKGVALEGLSLGDNKKPRLPYRSGMISLAVGLGVVVFGLMIGLKDENAIGPIVGMGAIPALIGAALIINDKINYAKFFENGD